MTLSRRKFLKGTLAIAGSAIALPVVLKEVIAREIDTFEKGTVTPQLLDYEEGIFTTENGVAAQYTKIGDTITVYISGKAYMGDLALMKNLPFKT